MAENSHIAYTQAQNTSAVPSLMLWSEELYNAPAQSGKTIDITGAELLNAISKGYLIYLHDISNTVNFSSMHTILMFQYASVDNATGKYSFVFQRGMAMYHFSYNDSLNEKLVLTKKQ